MPFLDWLFKPRRPQIVHENAQNINIESIANDTDFSRCGSGLTCVTGSVGHGVKLTIEDDGNLTIRGNIGTGCSIYKSGNGTLLIEGTVADDLKLTVYGQGAIRFTHSPPERVILAIKNPGRVAQIFCEGVALAPQRDDYVRHNMGEAARRRAPNPPPLVIYEEPAIQRRAPAAVANADQYTELTKAYIDATRAHQRKSIDARIKELALTEEEKPLFESFIDPITFDYFDDIPVQYNEKYFNLSTILGLYQANRPDPYTRDPLKLANIQPARTLLNNFDEAIKKLKEQREALRKAKIEADAQEKLLSQSPQQAPSL